jgi:hypothetical protein
MWTVCRLRGGQPGLHASGGPLPTRAATVFLVGRMAEGFDGRNHGGPRLEDAQGSGRSQAPAREPASRLGGPSEPVLSDPTSPARASSRASVAMHLERSRAMASRPLAGDGSMPTSDSCWCAGMDVAPGEARAYRNRCEDRALGHRTQCRRAASSCGIPRPQGAYNPAEAPRQAPNRGRTY